MKLQNEAEKYFQKFFISALYSGLGFQSGSVIGLPCSALSISVPGVPSQSHHRFSRGRTLRKNNRDRPAQAPYCGVLFATCKLLCLQSFALTSMSFSDLPLLYDIIGGFLKMVRSNG